MRSGKSAQPGTPQLLPRMHAFTSTLLPLLHPRRTFQELRELRRLLRQRLQSRQEVFQVDLRHRPEPGLQEGRLGCSRAWALLPRRRRPRHLLVRRRRPLRTSET